MHGTFATTSIQIEPAILYMGTPVVLIGTCNEDGSYNLAPMSSAWWLGWRCELGLALSSKTTENIKRTGECVLNLPSADLVGAVDRLARTTGSNPVPADKIKRGYRHEKDKFGLCALTARAGDTVSAPRALECPVQMEAKLVHLHELAQDDALRRGKSAAIEMRTTRVHAHPHIMMEDEANRILARVTHNAMHLTLETQRDTRTGGVAETLDIKISDELGTRNYELFSGGEAFRINFAVRVSLAKMLARRAGARLRTLVIDEGFGTQDTEGLERLVEVIKAIQDDFAKIIVITHLRELKNSFETHIEVKKDPVRGSFYQIL